MNLEEIQKAIKHLKSLRRTLMLIVAFYIIVNAGLVCMEDKYEFDLPNILLLLGTLFFLVALILIQKLIKRHETVLKKLSDK